MLSEKEYDEKLKIVCLWSFSQASCYTAVWRQRITWSGRERGLTSAEEEVAKGVLDDKVEVAEESVTNFSISKSSEHSNVVQETFILSHNWSEWLQHWTWLKRRQRQRQRLSRKRRKWNMVQHSMKITLIVSRLDKHSNWYLHWKIQLIIFQFTAVAVGILVIIIFYL